MPALPHAPAINPLVAGLAPPPVPAVSAWASRYDGSRGPALDLSQAAPGYAPHADMLSWLAEASGSPQYAGYGPITGEMPLRIAYAQHVSGIYNAAIRPANIHVTSGCNQAFMCTAIALARAGERIALTDPFYFNHQMTLSMLGIDMETIGCDADNGFLPDVADVARVLAAGVRAVAIVTPNNPTGAIYPAELLHEIFLMCRAAGAWLIIDETYRDFLPDGAGRPHGLFDSADWDNTLVQLYSFSKSFCIPGHRLGAVTAGEMVVGAIMRVMDNLQICAPRPPQIAVARGLPAHGAWREQNREEITRRAEALRGVMAGVPEWKIDSIGACFAFIRHPFAGVPSAIVAEALSSRSGISCLPGTAFSNDRDNWLRFAFINADCETLETLGPRLAGFSLSSENR